MGSSSSTQLLSQLNDSLQSVYNNVLTQTSTNISNFVSSVNILTLESGPVDCDNFGMFQQNKVNLNYKNDISNEDVINLKTELNSQIENKNSQIMKIVRQFLGGIGTSSEQNNITMIQTRLRQIINNNISVSHESKILNETIGLNELHVIVHGPIKGKYCEWRQDNLIEIASENLAKNLIQTCVQDSVISRIVNDSQQKFELEEKGPLDFIMIIVVLLLSFGMIAKEGVKAITDWKLWLLVGILIVIAYFVKIWPFKKQQTEFWGCAKDNNGSPTGECKSYDNPKQGPFFTKALCEKASDKLCVGMWGCDSVNGYYNKQCRTFSLPTLGPYQTKQQCEQLVKEGKACGQIWSCGTDTKGFNLSPAVCVQYKPDSPDIPDPTFTTFEDCEASKDKYCNKSYNCGKDKKCVEVGISPYHTIAECNSQTSCKK